MEAPRRRATVRGLLFGLALLPLGVGCAQHHLPAGFDGSVGDGGAGGGGSASGGGSGSGGGGGSNAGGGGATAGGGGATAGGGGATAGGGGSASGGGGGATAGGGGAMAGGGGGVADGGAGGGGAALPGPVLTPGNAIAGCPEQCTECVGDVCIVSCNENDLDCSRFTLVCPGDGWSCLFRCGKDGCLDTFFDCRDSSAPASPPPAPDGGVTDAGPSIGDQQCVMDCGMGGSYCTGCGFECDGDDECTMAPCDDCGSTSCF